MLSLSLLFFLPFQKLQYKIFSLILGNILLARFMNDLKKSWFDQPIEKLKKSLFQKLLGGSFSANFRVFALNISFELIFLFWGKKILKFILWKLQSFSSYALRKKIVNFLLHRKVCFRFHAFSCATQNITATKSVF